MFYLLLFTIAPNPVVGGRFEDKGSIDRSVGLVHVTLMLYRCFLVRRLHHKLENICSD